MSKNLTLKGAAFGALVALSVSAIAPASAAGLADTTLVTLAPSSGTEYTVITGASEEFSLKANFATSIQGTGKYVKFQVEDASNTVTVDHAASSTYTVTADASSGDFTITSNVVALDLGVAHKFKVGDRIAVTIAETGSVSAPESAAASTAGAVISDVSGNVISYAATGTIADVNAGAITAGDIDAAAPALIKFANASNKFVFQTRKDTNTSDATLVLETASTDTTSTATRVAKVTAWVDNNNNDVIDDSEYVSPTRTVTWIKPSELTISTTIDPVVIGDANLTGYATTSPVLNGNQVTLADIDGVFGRQGTATTEEDGTAEWSDTTKKFTFSQTLTPNTTVWEDLKEVGVSSITLTSATLVTVVTNAAHGLTSTDKVLISGITVGGTDDVNGIRTATVTDSKTFTIPVSTATSVALGTSPFVGGSRGIAGTYTLLVDFAGAEGTKASTSTAAKKVSTVTSAVTSASGVAADGDVKTGTKSLTVTATLKDSSSVVLAGRQVKVTASGITGTHYLNGTKVANNDSVWATSDANGVATVTVTSDTAANLDNLDLAFASEGVSGSAVNLDWMDSTYVIHEGTSGDTSTNTRTVNKSGSLTLDLNVVDDWGVAIDSSIYRLKVAATNRQVFTKFVTLSAGKASVTVTDENISGSTISVAVTLQKLVSGTWADSSAPSLSRTFTVNTVDQTDAVLLDVDAATTYGSGTADLSDAVAGSALTVVADATLNNGAVFTDAAAVAVTGRVANASTNVGRAGSVVTVSGSSDFLFVVGNKSAKGSLTFVADANGEFDIAVLSNKAAKDSVVTVASNGKSATTKVTFTPLVAVNTGITFEPVASAVAGRTIDLSVKFTDKWGNLTSTATAGTATFTATGPGWLVTNNSAVTSVDGIANNKLITNAEDRGTAVITVTTNINDADGNAIKFTKSIEIGATPAPAATAAIAGSTGKVYASVSNAAGKTVVVKINGVTKKTFAGTLAKKTVVVYSTAGAKNVSVFVGGSRVATKVVTIK